MANMDSLLGKQLDEYRLEKLLGQGGMAKVYRGFDTQAKRYVAIKVIDAQFREDSEYARRFELEAQSLGQLNHPNVVQLYRYGRVGDVLYMAMSYIEGSDVKAALDDYHSAEEYMAVDEALRVLRETAAALDYVHSQGIIHRDIKPSNIMLDKDGRAILTDFGLALITQVGTMGEIFGTPQYLSPEQAISSAAVVPQSDLYALGIIAYEIFTGRIPFDGAEPMTVAIMHMNDVPPPPRSIRPDLSAAVEAVLLKMIEKEPEQRYQTGAEFVQALEIAVKGASDLKRTSLPRLSIPQLVALEIEKNPLPPIPAAVTPAQKKSAEMPSITERAAATESNRISTLPHQAPVTQPSTKPPIAPPVATQPRIAAPPKMTSEVTKVKANPLRAYLPYAIGGILFALALISGIFFFVAGQQDNDSVAAKLTSNPTIVDPDFLGQTATSAAATAYQVNQAAFATGTALAQTLPTSLATINPTNAPTVSNPTQDNSILNQSQTEAAANIAQNTPIIIPSNSPASQSAQIRLTWNRDKWLLLEHLGGGDLLLGRFNFIAADNAEHFIRGRDYGAEQILQAGQCVAYGKENELNRLETACSLVATFIVEEGRNRVWKAPFEVFYLNDLNARPIVTCEGREDVCLLEIILGG